jgi:hypothetical protein
MLINRLAVKRAEHHLRTRKADVTPKSDGYPTAVADALADLMHLCNKHGISFGAVVGTAIRYVRADNDDTEDKNTVEIL